MGSSNQTAHFGLNQWVEDDPVLREDFNADNQKMDAAVHFQKPIFGTYVGAGATKEVILGFRPSFVFVRANARVDSQPVNSAADSAIATGEFGSDLLSITDQGFCVARTLNNSLSSNASYGQAWQKAPYRYIAYR